MARHALLHADFSGCVFDEYIKGMWGPVILFFFRRNKFKSGRVVKELQLLNLSQINNVFVKGSLKARQKRRQSTDNFSCIREAFNDKQHLKAL